MLEQYQDDRASWELIVAYKEHRELLKNKAFSYVNNSETAEDLDTF